MRKITKSAAEKSRRFESAELTETDEQLMKLIDGLKTSIKVVGVGGAGCNTITRLSEIGIEGAETITMNTDAQDLLYSLADKKVLLGPELTGGLGAGADPSVGENCAKESLDEIASALQGSDLAFITCGLGGGTGSGAVPVVAEVAKDTGSVTVAVVTLPFAVEGKTRWQNAEQGLAKLRKVADTVVVIPNDKLMSLVPDLPLNAAFKVSDEILADALKGTIELVTKPGLVNLDFADLRAVLANGGSAVIGLGESTSETFSENRAVEAVEEALQSPLLEVDVTTADRALINVIGGPDMTLQEAEAAVEYVSNKISPESNIIWGAQVDENISKNVVKVMIVLSGVRGIQDVTSLSPASARKGSEIDVEYI
ncbi:MAG: cell division protein FtsZ [Candidatus Altiarchaeota archaeon]|nr:cell division protein FtsZ [Candidatus Altiarchaeota archaeon]